MTFKPLCWLFRHCVVWTLFTVSATILLLESVGLRFQERSPARCLLSLLLSLPPLPPLTCVPVPISSPCSYHFAIVSFILGWVTLIQMLLEIACALGCKPLKVRVGCVLQL